MVILKAKKQQLNKIIKKQKNARIGRLTALSGVFNLLIFLLLRGTKQTKPSPKGKVSAIADGRGQIYKK